MDLFLEMQISPNSLLDLGSVSWETASPLPAILKFV